jgi:2-deoxy-D-gluconate 3-dehydrogenase
MAGRCSRQGTLMNPFDLSGKVAVVTGARTGLGQALALALAESGAEIIGLGSRQMTETKSKISQLGRRFRELHCDLSTDTDFEALVADIVAGNQKIDILVNNAGIIHRADFLDVAKTEWDRVMNVNLRSVFFLTQAVARHMIKSSTAGRIINIASLLSFQGGIRISAYTASKHGLAGLTRLLANELASHRITVNAIAPGYMETDNTAALRADPMRSEKILDRIPMGRWGRPGDLATAVVFLASPASSYVTGTVIPVDGGWLAR